LDLLRPSREVRVEHQRRDRGLVTLGMEVVLGRRERVEPELLREHRDVAKLLQHLLVAIVSPRNRPQRSPLLVRARDGGKDEQVEFHGRHVCRERTALGKRPVDGRLVGTSSAWNNSTPARGVGFGDSVMRLKVNGKQYTADGIDDATPLLWVLRDSLGLVGTKYGCGIGACGACTVHLNGEPVRSCSIPASMAVGQSIITIEGLAPSDEALHPLQRAWIDEDVAQCGYCQAGQLMTAAALLAKKP